MIDEFIPPQSLEEQWDIAGLEKRIAAELNEQLPVKKLLDTEDALDEDGLRERILEKVGESYENKKELAGAEALQAFEKHILLRILDDKWKEHLATMDHLRQGIHLRGYAAKNP